MAHKEKVSIVLSCIDYRFWPDALSLLEQKFGEFDLIELAGGSKSLASPSQKADKKAVLESIGVAVKLHGARQIVLTNHLDCGAYGGSKNFSSQSEEIKFHGGELKKAEQVIKKAFPRLKVTQVIIGYDNKGNIALI